jgi:hypothetical protein
MTFVALRMLTGDRAKYIGLIFAIAFSTFLLENQSSIFAGILKRTTSQILDVTDADIWVMDKKTLYIDEVKALTDNDLYRVRGVPGVLWAVPLIQQPNHPAYVSNAAIIASAAAALVGAMFPQEAARWQYLGEEAGLSRIYAGIHDPSDERASNQMGKRLGALAVQRDQRNGL